MRASYRAVLAVLPLAAISVVVSWFLAQDGFWYYWVFEVLGFSLLLVFGMMGLLLPMYYQSASLGRSTLAAIPPIEASSGKLVTMSREELEGYWRAASRFGAVLFISGGAFVGFLDGWWVYEVFVQAGQGIAPSFGAAIGVVLGGVVLALLVSGVRSFTHRPVAVELTGDGLRIQHSHAPDLSIQWSDKKLWLAIEDQRDFYANSPRHAPWNLTIGRWSTYGVSTSFAQSVIADLRVRRPDVTETTIPTVGGKALRRYYVMP